MALSQHGLKLRLSKRAHVPVLKRWSEQVRSRHLFVMDAIGLVAAALIALWAWLGSSITESLVATAWIVGIVVFTQIAVNILLGLYTTAWRFASINEMWRVLACTAVGTIAAMVVVTAILAVSPPVTVGAPSALFWLMDLMTTLVVLAGPRFMIRTISEMVEHVDDHVERRRTLLYGAGWAGVVVTRSADRSPGSGVLPVGFLDDNLDLRGRRVAGLPVYGDVSAMARAKRATHATSLLITMPHATGSSVRRVVDAAIQLDLDVRTVPPVTDLIDGTLDAGQTRRVKVEDLLRRPLATEHSPELQELLRGRTVMVTGAAGSIGSELVRQLLALEPSRIVMVDQAESEMYMVARDLERRSQVVTGDTSITTHLIDVTDREAVDRLMRQTRPVVVFHAAAYKHVPMLEEHAGQAVRTNVGGTRSVVDAAIENGVQRFVLVSTDKAVKPSSVMGATKRIAEMIVAEAAGRTGRAYVSVRFGNVLGSNGSVIPVFQSQLENGQPLTITDERMTRYFMTIPEASWLILDAAAISESGCLYVLDMGEPVRIMDLAADLVRLNGRDPDSVPFTFTGLRPGEKLHEELFYSDEEVTATNVAKVLRSVNTQQLPRTILADLDRLEAMSHAGDDQALRAEVLAYVNTPLVAVPVATPAEREAPVANGRLKPVVPVPVHAGSNGSPAPTRPEPEAPIPIGSRSASRAGRGRQPSASADVEPQALDQRYVVASTRSYVRQYGNGQGVIGSGGQDARGRH